MITNYVIYTIYLFVVYQCIVEKKVFWVKLWCGFEQHRAVMGRDMTFQIVGAPTNVYTMWTFHWWRRWFEHGATVFQVSAHTFLTCKCFQTPRAIICTWKKEQRMELISFAENRFEKCRKFRKNEKKKILPNAVFTHASEISSPIIIQSI